VSEVVPFAAQRVGTRAIHPKGFVQGSSALALATQILDRSSESQARRSFHKKRGLDNARRPAEDLVASTHRLFGLEHTLTISAMMMLAEIHRQVDFDQARKLHEKRIHLGRIVDPRAPNEP
jgi:hypothetical protein